MITLFTTSRYRNLSDALLFLTAAVLLRAAKLAVRVFPLRCVHGLSERLYPSDGRQSQRITPERIVWAVDAASRSMPNESTCLLRALAAHTLLSRYGYRSVMFIGAAITDAGTYIAHAWIELNENVVIGGPSANLEQFTWRTSLPPHGGSRLL